MHVGVYKLISKQLHHLIPHLSFAYFFKEYMKDTKKLGPWGNEASQNWNFQIPKGQSLKGVKIRHGYIVDAIAFAFVDQVTGRDTLEISYGGEGGQYDEIPLDITSGEYITQISGTGGDFSYDKDKRCITSITIHTNLETYGPYGLGNTEGEYGVSNVQSFSTPSLSNNSIVGFFGGANEYLESIGILIIPEKELKECKERLKEKEKEIEELEEEKQKLSDQLTEERKNKEKELKELEDNYEKQNEKKEEEIKDRYEKNLLEEEKKKKGDIQKLKDECDERLQKEQEKNQKKENEIKDKYEKSLLEEEKKKKEEIQKLKDECDKRLREEKEKNQKEIQELKDNYEKEQQKYYQYYPAYLGEASRFYNGNWAIRAPEDTHISLIRYFTKNRYVIGMWLHAKDKNGEGYLIYPTGFDHTTCDGDKTIELQPSEFLIGLEGRIDNKNGEIDQLSFRTRRAGGPIQIRGPIGGPASRNDPASYVSTDKSNTTDVIIGFEGYFYGSYLWGIRVIFKPNVLPP